MTQPLWRPTPERIAQANLTAFITAVERDWGVAIPDYPALYAWSIAAPERFWQSLWSFTGVIAERRGERVLEYTERMPGARWFPEARLNFAENLLRRRDEATALVFWGEDRVRRRWSYRAGLYERVACLRQGLADLGVGPGDRVAAYLPNLPEAIAALLATSSLGAIWSSCSPDFGVDGVVDRFGQIAPKVLFAADGYFYNGKAHDCLQRLSEFVPRLPGLEHVVLVPYVGQQLGVGALPGAVLWDELLARYRPAPIPFSRLAFDHPLYILFSSGTTGTPKCIVHGAGGTLLQHLKEHRLHTDITASDRLFYYTTCGWMMWNWLVSGLGTGATLLLYDGSPFYPGPEVLFDYADAEGMTIFGTSAKYIDAVQKAGLRPAHTHRLAALRTMLSTGSPLAPESFEFVYRDIKADLCLSSISGGTDIVSCFALGNPLLPVRPGELQCRGLGMRVEVYDEEGRPLRGRKGELVCTAPFPSMPVGFWNDPDGSRYRAAYFERFPGVWHHGDYVELTEHDGLVIYGRSDATLNPGGVRIGTAEIYRQVERLDAVLESLVIGQAWGHDERLVLFVRLRPGFTLDETLIEAVKAQIRRNTSPRHVPARVIQVADIPRTKSGKLVELAVRAVVHGRPVPNREALANPEALELFRDLPELQQ